MILCGHLYLRARLLDVPRLPHSLFCPALQTLGSLPTKLFLEQYEAMTTLEVVKVLLGESKEDTKISLDRFRDVLTTRLEGGQSNNAAQSMFRQIDSDQSGWLSLKELSDWKAQKIVEMEGARVAYQHNLATSTFDRFDVDHSGFLDVAEIRNLCSVLGETLNDNDFAALVQRLDLDKSGQISREEYVTWFTNPDRM